MSKIIIYQLRPLMRLTCARFVSSSNYNSMQQQSSSKKGGKLPENIRKAQKLFQAKNNLPVFLKGGKKDQILYYSTLGLAGFGLVMCFAFYASYIID